MNPTPTAAEKIGFMPTYQRVSDFQFNEIAGLTGIKENAIDFAVPSQTKSRKIYAWIWAHNTGTDYFVKGLINFYSSQSFMGSLPVGIGGGNLGNMSIASVCTTNGSNVQDCLGIFLANPTGTQPSSLILQPLYIQGEFDRITFSIRETLAVDNIRCLLACVSSQ